MRRNRAVLVLFFVLSSLPVLSQTDTYILNGTSTQNSCNCYTLTGEQMFQGGSVWNAKKIDLQESFDFIFNVFLGCNDNPGADGIVFMLQPISTSIGTSGEGMGFEGVSPSIGIPLDTYRNTNRNDPVYDHISIQANGVINHNADLAGPVPISSTNNNVEDCNWHTLRISWDPGTKKLEVFFDGVKRLDVTKDLVKDIFNNDPLVYWGFAGATGGEVNVQRFCTALNPVFTTGFPDNEICPGDVVQFSDASQSFAPVSSYYWDFGDGTSSTQKTPPPHVYTQPGIYPVRMALTALDGCRSDTITRQVKVGRLPEASFSVNDTCFNQLPQVSASSPEQSFSYSWKIDGNEFSTAAVPVLPLLDAGSHQLELTVASAYGCGTPAKQATDFTIYPLPQPAISANDGCVGLPQLISGDAGNSNIVSWSWQINGDDAGNSQQIMPTFDESAIYKITLAVTDDRGCVSERVPKDLFINQVNAYAGEDITVFKNASFQLNGSGGSLYNWSPAIGLDNANSPKPTGSLQQDQLYVLEITSPEGCTDTDDVLVKVIDKADVYVPTAFTPNNDGLNDRFRPAYFGITQLAYFTVFNRWGNPVFTTQEINDGWDGTIKGSAAPAGAYVWTMKATDIEGNQIVKKGTVTLIR